MGNSGFSMIELENVMAELDRNPVLKGVSATLEPGKAIALLGANGAGKTTLLRLLAGLVPMTGGTLTRNGAGVVNTDPRWMSAVAFVSDRNDLFPELSAREHFEVARLLSDLDSREAHRREDVLLGLLRIPGDECELPVRQLSFGYQKRVALALCLFEPAELYLFDEPSTGLDLESIAIFEHIVGFLKRAGKTILISTHSEDWIRSLTEERLVMAEGRIPAADGATGADGDASNPHANPVGSPDGRPDRRPIRRSSVWPDGRSEMRIPEWLA